jgi:hypothetical protein
MNEAIIDLECKACKKVTQVTRTIEIPKRVLKLRCNWCPYCEDKNANDYWREWYVYPRKAKTVKVIEPSLFDNSSTNKPSAEADT